MTDVWEVSILTMRAIRRHPAFEARFWYTTPEDKAPGEEGRIGEVRYRVPLEVWRRWQQQESK